MKKSTSPKNTNSDKVKHTARNKSRKIEKYIKDHPMEQKNTKLLDRLKYWQNLV